MRLSPKIEISHRERFKIERNWILKFIKDNFKILNDFEIEGERYLVFEGKNEK